MKLFTIAILTAAAFSSFAQTDLEKRVAKLEQELASLKQKVQSLLKQQQKFNSVNQLRAAARKRMQTDLKYYSIEELKKIEQTYQRASKKWGALDCIRKFSEIVKKYPKSNRAGCAALYIGQMSKSKADKEKYFKMAIDKFGDCYYGDGVQVASYARFQLGYFYLKSGKKSEAKKLFDQIKEKYPDSIDHKGRKLVDIIKRSGI
ncbi:MAG: tetratricopeptide repeat protein [Lentisphaerae bacterium]|nr:tetratricopeptide repeat protein [Lentisphaerota bacterium]MCP4103632.1 tetratricopeptide repeat protein [Lentisphaerota bacterium]